MTCELGKQNFKTLAAAKTQCPSLRKKKKKAKTYWCQACSAWHLTTKKKKAQPYDRTKAKKSEKLMRREIVDR